MSWSCVTAGSVISLKASTSSEPIRNKAKANGDLFASIFPRLAPVHVFVSKQVLIKIALIAFDDCSKTTTENCPKLKRLSIR